MLVGLGNKMEGPCRTGSHPAEPAGQAELLPERIVKFRVTFKGKLHDVEISDVAFVRDIKVLPASMVSPAALYPQAA